MAEIGATLYESRIDQGLDVTEVEARTKIRAKYLRALEQEDWGLLPGPTFVKSFLRTYAEALGLDPRPLVEEYKFRHEPYDQAPAPLTRPGDKRRRRERRGVGSAILPMLLVLAVIGAALYGVTRLSQRDDPGAPVTPAATTVEEGALPITGDPVDVRLRARRATVVCLIDARGRQRISRRLRARERTPTYTSRRFDVAIGSGRVDLFINGTRRPITGAGSNGIAYRITDGGRDRLPQAQRPACAR